MSATEPNGRTARRWQAVLVLLALPAAVALTVAEIHVAPADAGRVQKQAGPGPFALAGVRVEVQDAGSGAELARYVVDRLVADGFEASLAAQGPLAYHERTEVVYYDVRDEEAASRVHRVVGSGRLTLAPALNTLTDVTVVLGKDVRSA
jgi:hypothetical protein